MVKIAQLTHAFNKCRRKKILANNARVADESISMFWPRTTKTGYLPRLPFLNGSMNRLERN